jgi:AcrR family transcriptional regulator
VTTRSPLLARPAARSASARRRARFEERGRRIREVAQRLLVERGLHGFSMDDVAEAIAYSKGTVYQHYRSKEDALLSGCAAASGELAERFERASRVSGRPRRRMLAVLESYAAYLRENLATFRTIPLMHSPTVRERASKEVLRAVESAQGRCVAAWDGIVRDAIEAGDLRLPRGTRPEAVTFALWSSMFGAYMLVELKRPSVVLGVDDPEAAVRATWATYMDGLGWRPTSKESEPGTARRPRAAGRRGDRRRDGAERGRDA